MRILLTGGSGLLGTELMWTLRDHEVTAPSHVELDITDSGALGAVVPGHDAVINAAAFTDVDAAESDAETAFAVNSRGAELLASAAHQARARFVQLSTDYVFHGDGNQPYSESAPLDPLGAYGRSKADGESRATAASDGQLHIVRTAWLYGAHGANFATTIARLARSGSPVRVVTDQRGQPTWAHDVASRITELLEQDIGPGIYHVTNSGDASWYDFARTILARLGFDPELVEPTDGVASPRPAPRPKYSVLGHDGWASTPLAPLRDWHDALDAAVGSGALNT